MTAVTSSSLRLPRASCPAIAVWLLPVWLLAAAEAPASPPANGTGTLSGTVVDPSGAPVKDAAVGVTGVAAARVRSDAQGSWTVPGLTAGLYRLEVSRRGFAGFAQDGITIVAGQTVKVAVGLQLARIRETVNVNESREGSSAGTLVLQGALLDSLPDDPDAMVAALAALAGAVPGTAPPVLVDGFEGGRVPPKAAIRMIRLNASPYSAEYEYPGLGRIEIFTKPGGEDGLHGHVQARVGGRALDTRDPGASGETPGYHRLDGSGAVSGPLSPGRASFFLDFERAAVGETRLVDAVVLGSGLAPEPRNQTLVTALARTSVSPRLDARLGSHTLTARYSWTTADDPLAGVGGFALPSRAFASASRQQVLQAGDTFSTGRVAHELRAQWSRQSNDAAPASLAPALVVQDAFSGGGADVGRSGRTQDRLEMHDVVTWTAGKHALRAGLRLRRDGLRDESRLGWNGSVTFAGGLGPALDASGRPVLDGAGRAVLVPLESLERYRRTLELTALGLSPAQVRALGGGASEMRVAFGEAAAAAAQWDAALFVQDEWRLRPDLAVGVGVRAEAQPDLAAPLALAPRASFSWTPGRRGIGAPGATLRGGVGLFYERVGDQLFLDARRLDGTSTRSLVVTDPALLDLVRLDAGGNVVEVPPLAALVGDASRPVSRRLAEGLRAPMTLAASISADRALGGGVSLTAQWSHTTTWRALRSRVVSADRDSPLVWQYESTGRGRQDQVMVGTTRLGRRLSLSARYFLSFAYGDTDGPGSFPASSVDPAADWSRASGDVRHRFVLTGSAVLPGDVRFSPFVVASSGMPYDITIGRDLDGDSLYGDRPAYAADPSRPGVVATPYGLLDPRPVAGEVIIPRNLGVGPGVLTVSVRLSRAFSMGGRGRSGSVRRELTLSLYAQNVLDRTNSGPPVGNMASPDFGRTIVTAAPTGGTPPVTRRTVELQLAASF
jgi:hypothetical protein